MGEALSGALAKLPPHHGVVYRGGSFAEQVLACYVPGEVLREAAFTSASVHGGTRDPVLYEIASTGGRLIAEFAEDPDEGEVVFDHGSHFLVLAVETVGGRPHILLADVPPEGLPPDPAAVIERIRDARATAVGPDARPGLAEGKAFFPVGVTDDGTPDVVARH